MPRYSPDEVARLGDSLYELEIALHVSDEHADGGSDAANHVVVLSFSVAWLAGFVAIPVPAGLGVREAILVLILAAPTPSVVVASIVHRLVLMCAEALLAVLAYLRRPRESQPSDR